MRIWQQPRIVHLFAGGGFDVRSAIEDHNRGKRRLVVNVGSRPRIGDMADAPAVDGRPE